MASENKKKKAKNSYLSNGGDKLDGKFKRVMYFTKRQDKISAFQFKRFGTLPTLRSAFELGMKGAEMKEIFDWLREQMEWNQIIEMNFDGTPPKQYVERERWVDVIKEAEAKWKEDCCEWKLGITRLRKFDEYMWVTSCDNGNEIFGIPHWIVKNYNVCPYCGKPIKIVEVE